MFDRLKAKIRENQRQADQDIMKHERALASAAMEVKRRKAMADAQKRRRADEKRNGKG